MLADEVFISGIRVNPKHCKYIIENNIIPKLPKSSDSLMFYVQAKNANNTSKDQIIACKFGSSDDYLHFINDVNYGNHIYLIGHLKNSVYSSGPYYNHVEVTSYKKTSHISSIDYDLAFVAGEIGHVIHSPFKELNVNDDITVDIYEDYNRYNYGDYVNLLGFLGISINISTFADNNILISKPLDDSLFKKKLNDIKSRFLKIINNKSNTNDITTKISENDIFNNFHRIIEYNNMTYNAQDVINFHVAMKNRGLVILAGPSGTGKTELVRCYAESLGLLNLKNNDNSQYLHISVSPSWTDDTDLLGYYDVRNHEYYPSNTGLVDLLYNAYQNRNKLYIVLFDEMNLSHIEYYFSQFLSILELPEGDPNRCIRLYDKSYEEYKDNNLKNYPSSIPVYNNILFVGTINVDESTKQITDKVLDRSNLIKINSNEFSPKLFKSKNVMKLRELIDNITPITASKFKSFKGESEANSLSSNNMISSARRLLLTDLNELLKLTTNNKREIGYREVKQINEYLCDLPNENNPIIKNYMSKYHNSDEYKNYSDIAFDYQLSQRILDKLSGNKYELYNFISILYDCVNSTNSFSGRNSSLSNTVLNIIEPIKNSITKLLSTRIPHDYSSKIIRRKWLELHHYGFTR